MTYKPHPPSAPLLFGYDPDRDLPENHIVRLIDDIVETTVTVHKKASVRGQPAYDPRMCIKVLVYSYATGVRSSRLMERMCKENLPFLFLSRGQKPSYRTLCTARIQQGEAIKKVWLAVLVSASKSGSKRVGRIVLDSTKIAANSGSDCLIPARKMKSLLSMLEEIMREHAATDQVEETDYAGETVLDRSIDEVQMRDIVRSVTEYFEEHEPKVEPNEEGNDPPGGPPKSSGGVDPTAAIGSLFGEPDEQTENPDVEGNEAVEAPELQQAELIQEEPAAPLLQDQYAAEPVAEVSAPASSTAIDAASSTDSPPTSGKRRRYRLSSKMIKRVEDCIPVLKAAIEAGLKHVSLTDPDARMMGEGRHKTKAMCHAFEAATDNGFLVAGSTSNCAADNSRLHAIVDNAKQNNPAEITSVDADSGYFSGRSVGKLLLEGLDVCIPNAFTACDMRRGLPHGATASDRRGSVRMEYDQVLDQYTCPEGNVLRLVEYRTNRGADRKVYKAKRSCSDCPLQNECMVKIGAKYRRLYVTNEFDIIRENQDRFADEDHRARYHERAPAIETVFAVIRRSMGVNQWSVRGAKRVEAEAQIITAGYQLRKLYALLNPATTKKQARIRSLQSLQPQIG